MSPLKGNAALTLETPTGQKLAHLLNAPLKLRAVAGHSTTRFTRENLDLSNREVITIGDGRPEYEADVRFDRNAQDLVEIMSYAADGSVLNYIPDLTTGTAFPLFLLHQGPRVTVSGDRDRFGFGEYMTRIRVRDASASGQALEALFSPWLFKMRGGMLNRFGVFTRSGTVGPYTGQDGLLASMAADLPRVEWQYLGGGALPDTPGLLLESPAFTNLVDSDDLTAWSASGTPVVTGSVSDPAGGTGAYTVEDDDVGGVEFVQRNLSGFDDGEVNVVTFVVRENTMPASGGQDLRLRDGTAAANRLLLRISSWSSGEPQITEVTGTYLGSRYVGNGFWIVYGLTTAITEANTNTVAVQPAETSAQTGSIDVYRVNAFAARSAPWSIFDASETKNAETLYFPWVHVPQAMCGMVDFRELEVPDWMLVGGLTQRLITIGDDSNNAPRFFVYRGNSTDDYRVLHDNGISSVTSAIDLNPSWGDRVQLFWWLYADGSVLIAGRKQALGSSTWSVITTGTQSAALPLAAAWSDLLAHFGSVGSLGRSSQIYYGAVMDRGTALSTTDLIDLVA